MISSIQPILLQIQQQSSSSVIRQKCNDYDNDKREKNHSLLCFVSLFLYNNNKQNNISSWLLSSSLQFTTFHENHKKINDIHDDQQCVQLASQVLFGHIDARKEEFFAHMVANYHEYVSHTMYQYPNKEVMIIRIESLWEDIKHLDQTFFYNISNYNGINTTTTIDYGIWDGYQYTHDTEPYHSWTKDTSTIIGNSGQQRLQAQSTGLNRYQNYNDDNILKRVVITKLLCCTILNEMKLYQELIHRAVNLNTTTKELTLHNDAMKCGFTSWQLLIKECQEIL